MSEKKTGLELLREPFDDKHINKLPKGTKAQNECKAEEKINCTVCGGWHHPKVIHLDYVGHAALTDRLLDADPLWTWEPLAYKDGLPAFDATGGLWIKLTICGHTRIGYGHATASQYKDIGAREKEVIGDALRNAAMRFGAALDLWFKGDLHDNTEAEKKEISQPKAKQPIKDAESTASRPEPLGVEELIDKMKTASNAFELKARWTKYAPDKALLAPEDQVRVVMAKDKRKVELDEIKKAEGSAI